MDEKILLIVNPTAGRSAAHKQLFELLEELPRRFPGLVRQNTQYAGHARQIAARAEGFDRIVCCGGDGTLSEVLSGLAGAGKTTPVGYIAAGTTNDLCKTLHLPLQPQQAIDRAFTGAPLPYDLGRMNGSLYFDYVASFGAFTDAAYATPQPLKNLLGHAAYVLWGAVHIWRLRPIRAAVCCNGQTIEDEFIFGSVTNSTEIGGMVHLPPNQVKFDDGLYELTLVRHQKTVWRRLRMLWQLLRGHYDNEQFFVCRTTAALSFAFEEDTVWTLDGEKSPACQRAEIEIIPHAANLVRGAAE